MKMPALLLQVREIFNQAQDGINPSKLSDKCYDIELENQVEEFWEAYIDHLRKAMIYYKTEPAVEKVMEFCGIYATFHKRMKEKADKSFEDSDNTLENEETNPFLLKMFEFILKHHNARDKAVRYRCCQLINKMLGNLGNSNATIDEDISDAIYESMMIRLKDKFPPIRIQAVLALLHLQDPDDESCPVIDAFLHCLETDTNADVRKTVLKSVAISRKTLPYVLGRVRDVKDINRKTTFITLSEKVSIRALTIAQRIEVLTTGLKDRSEMVKHACGQLLNSWLKFYDYNVIKLLEALDTEASLECSKMVLEHIFKDASVTIMNKHVEALLKLEKDSLGAGDIQLPQHDILIPETVYYWYMVCKRIKEFGEEGEALLHQVLPELTNFCEYIKRYAEKYFIDSAILTAFDGKEGQSEFVLEYLLSIAGLLDFSDEVGRKNLKNLVHDLLVCETIPMNLVKVLVDRYFEVEQNEDKFIQEMVETISDIKQPLVQVVTTAMREKNRRNELQIARLAMNLNECKEDLENAIKSQNFQQAAILKDEIAELESQKHALQVEIGLNKEDAHQRVEKDDPETTLRCLHVASSFLRKLKKKVLPSSIMALKDELMFDGVKNEDPYIRNEAVLCLGHLSVMSKEFAAQHLVLFLQVAQVDQELLQITAVKVIFDLFMLYGLQAFDLEADDDKTSEANNEEKEDINDEETTVIEETPPDEQNESQLNKSKTLSNAAESVLSILILFLESESPDLRTIVAEGLAKLLVCGRVVSAKILSRLILLWYNPITEDDIKLRHCLGVFLPVFAFESRANQELLEECFLPVVKKIFNAPTTSPLSQVNVANVIDLMTQLTDVRRLTQFQNMENPTRQASFETHVHDSIAVKLCNEILTDPDDISMVKLFCKALTQLTICPNNLTAIEDLRELSSQLIDALKGSRLVLKMIEKFVLSLDNLSNSRVSASNSQLISEKDTNTTITTNTTTTSKDDTVIKNTDEIADAKDDEDKENDKTVTGDMNETLTDITAKALQQQLNDSLSRDMKHKLSVSGRTLRSSSKKPRLSLTNSSIDFAVDQNDGDGDDDDENIEDFDE